MSHEKIILAWDTTDWSRSSQSLLKRLIPRIGAIKLGLAAMTAPCRGTSLAAVVRDFVHAEGGKVFWDAKLNDIPTTVGAAVKNISESGVWSISVHASAGVESLEAAIREKRSTKIFGVTLLTSLSRPAIRTLFNRESPKEAFVPFARMLSLQGADGIICSPQELAYLKAVDAHRITAVTPGIRPLWSAPDDQKRTCTPKQALTAGADYLVIGRPIMHPPNGMTPRDALEKIIEEIS